MKVSFGSLLTVRYGTYDIKYKNGEEFRTTTIEKYYHPYTNISVNTEKVSHFLQLEDGGKLYMQNGDIIQIKTDRENLQKSFKKAFEDKSGREYMLDLDGKIAKYPY